jgi:magnesium-transporting ATPase (P-type)
MQMRINTSVTYLPIVRITWLAVCIQCVNAMHHCNHDAVSQGMGLENIPVLVYRSGIWQQTCTEELLPGDIFSLK